MNRKLAIVIVSFSSLLFPDFSWGWFLVSLPSSYEIEERQRFAKALLFEIDKIYSSIPELSPEEADLTPLNESRF